MEKTNKPVKIISTKKMLNQCFDKINELTQQTTSQSSVIKEQAERIKKQLEIFKWLLGYYDFPEPPKDGRPRYYWRKDLQEKLKEIGVDIDAGVKSPFQPREPIGNALIK